MSAATVKTTREDLQDRIDALESALRSYRSHPADHRFCLQGQNTHVRVGREYDNRCMQCVKADEALAGL